MSVTHIIIGLNVGGAELMLKRLVEAHKDSPDYRHVVVSLTSLGKVGEQLRQGGTEVHALGLRSMVGVPWVFLRLLILLHRLRPNIVQTWMYHADFLGGLAARLLGIRTIIWGVRTTDVSAGGSRATVWIRTLCAWLSPWVPQVIVCAAEASRLSHLAVGYDARRMVVIPNGFDNARLVSSSEQRQALRQQCGFAPDDVVLGTLGRFNEVKDPQNFVRAAGLLAGQYPRLRFLMVGRGLDARNIQLHDWIMATGHAERFVLLGECADAPVCLSAMDIFCLHSRTEGFPNVLGEAMAMGLPCVTTDVGDAAFLLGATGAVVSRENASALAKGIDGMLAMTAQERMSLGAAAKARVLSEFTMARSCERFEALYQKVMADAASSNKDVG